MSSIQVECWNCGLKLQVKLDKLATARCGNCQQMIAKEEQPEKEPEVVHPLPAETRKETRAEEKSQIKQKQEEKGFSETAETSPQNGYVSKINNSVHAITPKALLWGLSLSVVLALVIKTILALILTIWAASNEGEYRQEYFTNFFDFTSILTLLIFIRDVLTLALFCCLSLAQRFGRLSRYIVAMVACYVGLVALNAFALRITNPFDDTTPVNAIFSIFHYWGKYANIFLVFLALTVMDSLTRRRLQVEESTSMPRTDEWPEKFHQAKNGIGVFVIVLGALPLTLISSFCLSVLVCGTLLLVASGVTSKNFFESIQTQQQLAQTLLFSVAAIIWFFMFRMSMRKGMRALKEGEGIFSALLSAILDPIRFLPGGR